MKSLESMHTQISFCRPIQGEGKVNDWHVSNLGLVVSKRVC